MGLNEKFFKSATVEAGPFFNTVIYTGDSAATNNISGVGFSPDLVWIKNRTKLGANWITDSVRGASKAIMSQSSSGEITSLPELMSSFNSDGFTVGYSANDTTNISTSNYVAWCFKAGGAAVSNTDGDVQSNVSANVGNGFSIVKGTGSGSGVQTVGHGLNSAPELVLVKNINATDNWWVYSSPTGVGKYLQLNTGAATANWSNNMVVNSTEVGIRQDSTGSWGNLIAYCFHSVAGVSKVGSYAGSNSNLQVNTGFEPSFLMLKNINTSGRPWIMVDNLRTGYVEANSAAAEVDTISNYLSFNSTGFLLVGGTGSYINEAGANWIYLAIA